MNPPSEQACELAGANGSAPSGKPKSYNKGEHMEKRITDAMIEKRRLENDREYKRKWAERNREHIREYHRTWRENFKKAHGESYGVYRGRKKALEQLQHEKAER